MIMAAAAIQPKISPASPLFFALLGLLAGLLQLVQPLLGEVGLLVLDVLCLLGAGLELVSWIAFFSAFTMATRSAASGIIGIDMPSAAAPPVGNGTNSPGDIWVGGRVSPGVFGRML